jgi:endoglucanase
MASGGDDISHIDTSPPQEAYILYGAVVGGPDPKDRFYDIRSDWPETEVQYRHHAPLSCAEVEHPIMSGCVGLQRPDAHTCRDARPE